MYELLYEKTMIIAIKCCGNQELLPNFISFNELWRFYSCDKCGKTFEVMVQAEVGEEAIYANMGA